MRRGEGLRGGGEGEVLVSPESQALLCFGFCFIKQTRWKGEATSSYLQTKLQAKGLHHWKGRFWGSLPPAMPRHHNFLRVQRFS